jgi:hypothetical protein
MRLLCISALILSASLSALPVAAQSTTADFGASIRLQNELRWTQGQLRALEAETDRLRTVQTLRRLDAQSRPDPLIENRQAQLDATEAENLRRAAQAASTANASRLRAADPAYDRRLRDLGYATSLPVGPGR